MHTTSTRTAVVLALPAVAAALLYLPVLHAGFVWDDTLFLVDTPYYRDPANWGAALARPFLLSPNYYRPLALSTFLVELRLFGLAPWAFHLTNLVLHSLNTLLVTRLAAWLVPLDDMQEGSQWPLPLLAAGLVYAFHPALVESVAFISSRFDLLLTAILLTALLLEQRLAGWRATTLLAAGSGLAMLTKEMAAGFLAVYPLWWWATRQRNREPAPLPWSDLFRRWGGVVAGTALALLLRGLALGALWNPQAGNPLSVGNLMSHVLLVLRSLGEYVLLALWPFTTLTPIHYADLPMQPQDPANWPGMLVAVAALGALAWWLRRGGRAARLGLAGVAALGPVLNIVPLELGGGAFIAERFLTFPLVFPALALAVVLSSPAAARVACLRNAGTSLWLVAAIATVQLTLPRWRSDETLWRWAMRRAPQSSTPYANLALGAVNSGRYAEGLALAEEALARDPGDLNAANNKGLALFHLGRYEEAEAIFADLVARAPQELLYWNNLAGALREQGQLQEAERILWDRVLAQDPAFPPAHLNLGVVYLLADRPDLAAQHLSQAARLLPPARAAQAQVLLAQTQDPVRWLRLARPVAGT